MPVLQSQRDCNGGSETDLQGITMSNADTYIRARIDTDTKERAAEALQAMGLSISDAIRLLMLRIADERRLPFEVKVPNTTMREAIAELESGKGKRFASVDDLMADLHADDCPRFILQTRLQARGQRSASRDATLKDEARSCGAGDRPAAGRQTLRS